MVSCCGAISEDGAIDMPLGGGGGAIGGGGGGTVLGSSPLGLTRSHSAPSNHASLLVFADYQQKAIALFGHFWPLRAEGRRSLALRQWRFHHPLVQARLRQPSACPWTQRLLTRESALFRRNRACDLVFKRDRQRCGDGASPKRPVCHSHSPHPQAAAAHVALSSA